MTDFPKDTQPSKLLQEFRERTLPTSEEQVSIHQQILSRWGDASLTTLPSKDLLKAEIDESDFSNVIWVGSRFNQPFLHEEGVLSSQRIDPQRTLWLYDPKRCWVDVLVRRVYLGGAYNRRHCKSDHELMALCPKKALTVALQMHFSDDDEMKDIAELLERLRKQSFSDAQCLIPTCLLAASPSFLAEIAPRIASFLPLQKKKQNRKRTHPSLAAVSTKNAKRIKRSAVWLDSVPSQDHCEMAARLLQQWTLHATALLQESQLPESEEEQQEKEEEGEESSQEESSNEDDE